MWNPFTMVRCRVAGKHRWEPVGDDNGLDTGLRCRDCDELVLERHFVEQNHDAEAIPPYGAWGAGAGASMPDA